MKFDPTIIIRDMEGKQIDKDLAPPSLQGVLLEKRAPLTSGIAAIRSLMAPWAEQITKEAINLEDKLRRGKLAEKIFYAIANLALVEVNADEAAEIKKTCGYQSPALAYRMAMIIDAMADTSGNGEENIIDKHAKENADAT